MKLVARLLSLAGIVVNIRADNRTKAAVASFDNREATINGIHTALFSGATSCRYIVSSFLARIEAFNPRLNAIISLSPDALAIADEMDHQLSIHNATGPLFCIPILLKDNYDTYDMPTTGGCLDMVRNKPTMDAPVVTAFKKAGAIILGKTNLHELALEGLSVSSLGGQTVNPYDSTRTPGGSSGGTGASIAASFAVFGTGSDTVNSLRSPASANNLFSIRPTRGLIARTGIMPVSYTQDAIGPIARTVEDLAVALTVMASVGKDKGDNTTSLIPVSHVRVNYSAFVPGATLRGMRFGLIEGFFNRSSSNECTPVNDAMDRIVTKLQEAGATVLNIQETVYSPATLASLDVQKFEFREAMNAYLQKSSLGGRAPDHLETLYSSGRFLVIPGQYGFINTALVSSTRNSSYAAALQAIQNLETTLKNTMSSNDLDALIYPEQRNLVVPIGSPSQAGRNGILAALTGFPVVTVPIGFSPKTAATEGIPIGMEILGSPWSESNLLNIASHISQLMPVRKSPALVDEVIDVPTYTEVPFITPNTADIPDAYPTGVL